MPPLTGKLRLRRRVRLSCNEMRNFRRTDHMETGDCILQDTVRISDAFVLTEMGEPGIQQERLDEAPLLSSILEHAPLIRSVAVAFTPQLVDRSEKRLAIARIDSVFDRHQDGPAIVVELMESNRRWPMHRRRQI